MASPRSAFRAAFTLLSELEASLPEVCLLIGQCAAQMNEFLGLDEAANSGSLIDLNTALTSNLTRFTVISHANDQKLQAARNAIEALKNSVARLDDGQAQVSEVMALCGDIEKGIDKVSLSLSNAQDHLGTAMESIFEMAVKYDTPPPIIQVAKDLIERSKK